MKIALVGYGQMGHQIEEIAEFFNAEGAFIQLFNDMMEIIQNAVEVGFK